MADEKDNQAAETKPENKSFWSLKSKGSFLSIGATNSILETLKK